MPMRAWLPHRVLFWGVVAQAAGLPFVLGPGCLPEAPPKSALDRVLAARQDPMDVVGRLGLGGVEVYEVNAAAGQTLHVALGANEAGGVLDIGFVETPDGRVYSGLAALRAAEGVFSNVSGPTDEAGASRVGFSAVSSTGGTWRFSVVRSAESAAVEGLVEAADDKSVLEKLLLWGYLAGNLGAESAQLDPFGEFLSAVYTDLPAVRKPIGYLLRIAVSSRSDQVLELPRDLDLPKIDDPAFDPGDDDESPADNENTNDNASANDDTNDNTGNGNANGNTNANSNGNGNTNTNDNGNDTIPTQVGLTRLVQSGDDVPDQPSGTRFTFFSRPIIDAEGRVAFWAAYSGGNGDAGLYVWESGSVRRVIDDNPQRTGSVPGRGPSDYFGDIRVNADGGSPPMCWGTNGRLIFAANSRGSANSRGLYRWRAGDGDMIRVVDTRQLAGEFPDVSSNTNGPVFSAEFFQPGLSDDGIVAFTAKYSYITTSSGFVLGTGVFTSNGATLEVIADKNLTPAGQVPDQPSNARFGDAAPLTTLNAVGEILFQAAYTGGSGDHGVYLVSGENVVRVLDNAAGRNFPGLPAGATVGAANAFMGPMAIGNEGEIAVQTKLTVNSQTRDAVLLWDNSTWRELTAPDGSEAKALVSGVNDDGNVVFVADDKPRLPGTVSSTDLASTLPVQLIGRTVTWGPGGGSINNNGRALITYVSTSGGTSDRRAGAAFWTGAQLLIVADSLASRPTASLIDVSLVGVPELDRPGRSGALNDSDEMALRTVESGPDGQANTADDVQAILLGVAQ